MGRLEFRWFLGWYVKDSRMTTHRLTPVSRLLQHQHMDDLLSKYRRRPFMVAVMDMRLGTQVTI
jgi:hypothetical protein